MATPLTLNTEEYNYAARLLDDAVARLATLHLKPEAKDYNPRKALDFLIEHNALYRVKGYLVGYVVDVPWYADNPVLCELLVLRFGSGGTLRDVTQFFESEARLHGCDRICTGTLLSADDNRLAQTYERLGFQRAAIALNKEIS